MHIAIIGAGFSGLATAWHLMQSSAIKITLFDVAGIGGGASGIAAGLLHPYVGAHSKLNWRGKEGVLATLQLIREAERALNKPVADFSGFLRVALNEEQEQNFALCARTYEDVSWYTYQECKAVCPSLNCKGGIFISSAITVNANDYLQGLWKACQQKGAVLIQQKINSLSELNDYDAIVVASGAHCRFFQELSHISLTPVKGQILELKWPLIEVSKHPLSSQAYLLMNSDKSSCLVGATFERNYGCDAPNLEVARQDLMPKVSALIPELKNATILNCRAGIRASTPSHLPFVSRVNDRCWVISGMGSKGLLYHALYAEQLAALMLK